MPNEPDKSSEEIDGILTGILPRSVASAPGVFALMKRRWIEARNRRWYATRVQLLPSEAIVDLQATDVGTLQAYLYAINFSKKPVRIDRAAITKLAVGNSSLFRTSEYIVATAELRPGDVKQVQVLFELRPDEIQRLLGSRGIAAAEHLRSSPGSKLHVSGRLVGTRGGKPEEWYFDSIFPTDVRVHRGLAQVIGKEP